VSRSEEVIKFNGQVSPVMMQLLGKRTAVVQSLLLVFSHKWVQNDLQFYQ